MKHSCFLIFTLAALSLHAEDWPGFRGVNGSGVSSSKKLPHEFSSDTGVAWKAEVGDGVGSPVIMAGRVFTTGMTGEKALTVAASL